MIGAATEVMLNELWAVTYDMWSDGDYEEAPERRQLVADIQAGVVSPLVLDEAEDCLTRDWCAQVPRVRRAFWSVLAAHGRLEQYDPSVIWTRRPRTALVNGLRYIVG